MIHRQNPPGYEDDPDEEQDPPFEDDRDAEDFDFEPDVCLPLWSPQPRD